ncbi:hypothetical protein QOZ80_5BG0419950 [Eleusine coracana subsp. coracana]|nr:hypothetical protein QOZ80_5BG0419950 [Eleusine coracana subsp. coracana]
MGCRSSRLDAADVSPAAALCRERRDLLRVAAERRAHLAAAHAAYFSALPRVADALARFASHHHAATPPGSPVLTLPPSDPDEPKKPNANNSSSTTPHIGSGHSHIHFHDDVSEDDTDGPDSSSSSDACAGPGGCGGGGHAAEIPQPAPAVLHSGAAPPQHNHGHDQTQHRQARQPVPAMPGMPSWDGHPQQPQLHLPVPAMPGMPSWDAPPQERQLHHHPPYQFHQQPAEMPPWGEYAAASYNPYPSFPNPTFHDDATFQDRPTFPRYYYMQASATPASTVYQDPYGYGNFDTNMSYMGYYNNPMYGVPMPPPEGDNSRPPPPEDRRAREPAPPPPMPVPETSPWDFFNPFDAYEQEELPPQYGSRGGGGGGGGSATSSPNSSEVRAREGIPELEEETELESMRESVKARKAAAESSASDRIDRADDVAAKVKESMERRECGGEIESVGSASVVVDSGEESVCSCDSDHDAGAKPVGDDGKGNVEKVGSAAEQHSSVVIGEDVRVPENVVGTRDVAEVVEEIKEQFNSVASCGEDVARILEVGRMRYRSRKKILRLVFSRMIGTFALLFSSMSEPPAKNLDQSAISSSKRNQNPSKRFDFVSDVELNTLSATMDRLYVWEKRLHKEIMEEERLRITYEREWKRLKELDATGAEPYKIDATRASIRTLLTRINIAMRSAKVISRRIHILRDNELHPHLVTLIQGLIRMWRFIFECHRKQFQTILETKSHILIPKNGPERSSSKEKEETADGVAPFSPGRLGAPAVFITANDWCQAMNRIPEGTVVGAMEAFAVNVHILWERQDEEQQEKLKAEYLSRDFAKRLKSLQKEHGLQGHLEADKPVLPTIADDGRAVDSRMVALDTLHKRLDEQKARHEETVKQIREASATDLKAGLAPIFEALESFTHETLRGYENVRIPTESTGA